MARLSTLAALALTSALLTPFVVEAAGAIRLQDRTAAIEAAPVADVRTEPQAPAAIAAPVADAAPAACAKRVKVVYGAGTGCAPTPETRI